MKTACKKNIFLQKKAVKFSCVFLGALLFCSASFAAWDNIAKGGRLCGQDKRVCFSGRIDMERNDKIITITGRYTRLPGKGTVTFEFFGVNPLDEHVYYSKSDSVKGGGSEIIDLKFGPPYSNETVWELVDIKFVAEES